MTPARWIGSIVLLVGALFALLGGEYGTFDWWDLRQAVLVEQADSALLVAEIDSLGAWADALESDPATQEKVARESFGMLRPGEVLYRVERRDP